MYKDLNYTEKEVDGVIFKIPQNIYLREREEKEYFKKIKKIKTAYEFLSFVYKEAEDTYNYIGTRQYLTESKLFITESRNRRSFTDLLGLYLTYFPEEDNTEGILKFTQALYQLCEEKGLIGHYCTSPRKIVFFINAISSDFYKKWKAEDYPLLKGYFPDLVDKEEEIEWLQALDDNSYLDVIDFKDGLTFEGLRHLFNLCK